MKLKLFFIKIIIVLSIFSCHSQNRIKRTNRDVKELESVEISDWKGWIVLSYPDSKSAIIRNNNRIVKVKVPKWFTETFSELDTIQ